MSRDEIRESFFEEGLIRLDETPCDAFDPSVELTPDRWVALAECARIPGSMPPSAIAEVKEFLDLGEGYVDALFREIGDLFGRRFQVREGRAAFGVGEQ